MGGALTIAALTEVEEIDAGVAFYGVPSLKDWDISKIKAPLMANFGETDQMKGFSDIEVNFILPISQ